MDEEVRRLILELRDGDPSVRWNAAWALGNIGLPAVPALIPALRSGDSDVREGAAGALGAIAERHPEYEWSLAVPALIGALGDEYSHGRGGAAGALVKIGLPAVPALTFVLGKGDPDVRLWAAFALGNIAGEHPEYDWGLAVRALIGALGDGNSYVRESAALALENIAQKHPKYDLSLAVPALIVALGDGYSEVREMAAWALVKIGLPAVRALIVALGDGDSGVRKNAGNALEDIEPRNYRDLNALIAIGRELKKEKKDFGPVMELYSKWVKALNEKADRGFADKRFHVPKVGTPDKVERIRRVARA